jgi:DNA-directed RNA polymerase specialized sigma24 family protein
MSELGLHTAQTVMGTFTRASIAPPGANLSPHEIAVAIEALTDAEKTALVKIARFYSQRTQYAHEDLVQEAICRVLEGRRAWPRELPGKVFLGGVMRSIAWEWKDEMVETESDAGDDGAGERGTNALLDAKSIIAQFNDDSPAQSIVVGMMEGLRGEELEQASGLTDTEYQSKRKKIRRRLEKIMMTVMP